MCFFDRIDLVDSIYLIIFIRYYVIDYDCFVVDYVDIVDIMEFELVWFRFCKYIEIKFVVLCCLRLLWVVFKWSLVLGVWNIYFVFLGVYVSNVCNWFCSVL